MFRTSLIEHQVEHQWFGGVGGGLLSGCADGWDCCCFITCPGEGAWLAGRVAGGALPLGVLPAGALPLGAFAFGVLLVCGVPVVSALPAASAGFVPDLRSSAFFSNSACRRSNSALASALVI